MNYTGGARAGDILRNPEAAPDGTHGGARRSRSRRKAQDFGNFGSAEHALARAPQARALVRINPMASNSACSRAFSSSRSRI